MILKNILLLATIIIVMSEKIDDIKERLIQQLTNAMKDI